MRAVQYDIATYYSRGRLTWIPNVRYRYSHCTREEWYLTLDTYLLDSAGLGMY